MVDVPLPAIAIARGLVPGGQGRYASPSNLTVVRPLPIFGCGSKNDFGLAA